MKLNFDKNSLEMSRNKVITSVISIIPGDNMFFPERNWNDNIVITLNSWILNILDIMEEGCTEVQLSFFDGPFSFKIKRKNKEYTVELLQGSKQGGSYCLDFYEFGCNLVKLTQEILTDVQTRGWESDDLNQLELSLKKMLPRFDLRNKQNR